MIPLFKVNIPTNIKDVLQKVFDQGILTEGEYSDKFENAFSSYVDNPYCALTNSGTSALTLAYRLSNIGPGSEVITTPMTCMATNEPIHTMGAKIVFADIDPNTGNLCPDSVKKLLSKKTKAVVGVHWAGLPFKIQEINDVVKNYNPKIKVIEDAAHALGATYKNVKIGSHSDYVCFSFQAIKHLTTVDGGAICSKTEDDNIRLKKLRWFGLDRKYQGSKWEQDITESGYKFHMNNVNAAIGLEQLKHIESIVELHKHNGKQYDKLINNVKVKKLTQTSQAESSYWIYSLLVDDKERFKTYMSRNNIATDVVHVRNDNYSVFSKFKSSTPLKGVDEFCQHMINLPVGWWLTNEDVNYVIDVVNNY